MLKDIQDGSQINTDINGRDARLKICDFIRKTKNEWKGLELSTNTMGKELHKLFRAVVNKLNNALPNLGESGSKVSNFIPKPRNYAEVIRLPSYVNRAWLKETLKEIKVNQQSDLSNV